jgi:hypothetical protein
MAGRKRGEAGPEQSTDSLSPRRPPRFVQCADRSGARRDLVVAGGGNLLQEPDPGGALRRRPRPDLVKVAPVVRTASRLGELVAGSAPLIPGGARRREHANPLCVAAGSASTPAMHRRRERVHPSTHR